MKELILYFLVIGPLAAFAGNSDEGYCPELFKCRELSSSELSRLKEYIVFKNNFIIDADVDSILEVDINSKNLKEIENIIADGINNYFTNEFVSITKDGFKKTYESTDGQWRKTIKITETSYRTKSIRSPLVQIFYEDSYGGVIRLKPEGDSEAPEFLKHLRKPHGAYYIKLINEWGSLSWENEAFKLYKGQPLPKAPNGVDTLGEDKEQFLRANWTYKTHIPLGI